MTGDSEEKKGSNENSTSGCKKEWDGKGQGRRDLTNEKNDLWESLEGFCTCDFAYEMEYKFAATGVNLCICFAEMCRK
jgi:hypothetical protein